MKKSRLAKQFLEELRKTPVVSAVCSKLGLSRQSVYRWLDKDTEFRKEYDICLSSGRDNINDLAESKIISRIQNGEMRAIEYWLDNNSTRYIKPRQPLLRHADYYQKPMNFYIQTLKGKTEKVTVTKTQAEEKITDEPEYPE